MRLTPGLASLSMVVVICLMSSMLLISPAQADGCVPGWSNHCYAQIQYNSSTYGGQTVLGVAEAMTSNALGVANSGACYYFTGYGYFMNNDLWIVTRAASPYNYSVEQGQIDSWYCNDLNIYHFWSDHRPVDGGTNFNTHIDEADTLGHVYGDYIWYVGNNTYELLWWDASAGGNPVYSYSIDNTAVPPLAGLQAGTEYLQPPANGGLYTWDYNLSILTTAGWQNGWAGEVYSPSSYFTPKACIDYNYSSIYQYYINATSNNVPPGYQC